MVVIHANKSSPGGPETKKSESWSQQSLESEGAPVGTAYGLWPERRGDASPLHRGSVVEPGQP